ncbi:Brefeldin A-inhibited guanine nucleotide-exchange protein 3 [Acipenser ruthenus]|uniref:Brefeldin A-inhibited guanine nucleotide-exchange protein 3 n=1 Tax=Acipenser ruthenus TaxID=7906 RepID=A0A444UCT2_ACIRT|nr:Brefeldin A-inhibited guanine nucleotide-exchange protein 3 [Acipenser ruthenus]
MDGMTEACMKGGIEACFSSVSCVCSLLGALDELSQGKGLQPEQVNLLMRRLEELKDGAESTRESMEINEADFRWQRHVLSSEHTPWEPGNERSPDISISVTTDTGQTTLEGDLGQTTPEENTDEPNAILPSPCGQDNGEISSREAELETNEQPDVIQRSHALVYPDITNFLSVECRARSHGSRYSESNFSVDEQDLSRTEFDSCDQYSMAAEKDSGRSDVSDMGSDNCSLADEEQTPRDCPGHRSLRTAALSLKLLKNQEADQHSARLFVQSLVNLLPRLLSLQSTTEVDSSLQNFSSTFCLGLQVDIDGLGSSAIGGQLIHKASMQSPLSHDKSADDSVIAGVVFARYILIGCWKNLIDTLSTPLTGRMAGSSKGLVFILGAEGLKEQNQKERDTICLSLDGLRKAAGLSCALGVAANCASALAQMAAASCVQEDKDDKEAPEFSDTISQGVAANCASALAQMAAASCVQEDKDDKEAPEFSDTISQVKQKVEQKLEQMGRPQGVRLHTAHVLCMDAILNVGLEMGSHNHDCWPHVFRVCEYVSTLEHSHFSDGSTQPAVTITQAQQGVEIALELRQDNSLEQDLTLSHPVIQPLSIQELLKETSKGKVFDFRGGSLLSGSSAAKAVCTLSTQADRLFEDAANKLNLSALVGFLHQLRKASQAQLFNSVTEIGAYSLAMPGEAKSTQDHASALHLFRLGDVMLRIVRSKSRPLLHMMRAWSVVAPHLVEAACHKERHVSQKAVSFIHDVLTEVLCTWSELPHFHFNEALFRPFEHIMQLELCDEDVQDQVITSIGELVEVCSPQIKSGWRPLFSALRTVHGKCQAPVFDVFEAFISTDNIQVFANAATDYIMCLMKFVKGLGEVDCKEIGDCVHGSGYSSTDLCLPALDYLRRCSQLLAKIYKMPSKPIFLSARLASLPMKVQERSSSSEDGVESILAEFDDDTGLIQVWILLLEQLTAAVSNCPRQHQPPTLDLLFELLREVTKTPGPGFAIFSVIQLLLPVMSLWLQRSRGNHSYWDVAASNFKHAIGLSCELVVEHIHSFIHSDIGYESMINLMLKDLFKLLVACVAEPTETISRVGCSCIRYVLVTAGPVFTEEMWRLSCCALQDAFSATLEPVKNLLACFRSGSDSFSGDACEVKVAAPSHSATAEAEYWRIRAMAQQVLLQNLYDILLEEFVKSSFQAEPQEKSTPVSETKPAGFLKYISMQNLAIIFDLLLDSYRTARDFDTRPGLKYLLMKVSGVCGAANLYRQSAMSFNIYFQALICATLTSQENITAEQVKKILYEEEEGSTDSSQQCSSEDEDIFEETAQVSPPRGKEKRQWRAKIPSLSIQPTGNADWAWLVKRLHKLCMDLCTNYIQMHLDLESNMDEPPVLKADTIFFLPLFPSETSTPSTGGLSRKATPSEESIRNQVVETPAEETPTSGLSTGCLPPLTHKLEKREQGKKKEWWESAGNKLYTIATDKTISKLMVEYKKRKQQHNLTTFVKESKNDKKGDLVTLRGPDSPVPQRPQQLVDQGQMRHSFSAGPEVLRQEKRPRSGSMANSQNISLRDAEAQIQAWTNMVLTILNQIQLLPDPTFVALLPAVFPCISQLTCHVTDVRVRQAVREWLGRLGRVYDIIL